MNTHFSPWRRFTAIAGSGALVLGTLAGTAALVASVAGPVSTAGAAGLPTGATDGTKVPHYFGPWPNWANSPLTSSTAEVAFVDPAGTGAGAAATAQVDPATGGISAITMTAPGHDYSAGTRVTVGGTASNNTALATPVITQSGALVSLKVTAPGAGYSSLSVAVAAAAGDPGTGAKASATGSVDAVHLTDGGSGYTMPTVDFDLPSDPNGTQAKGHVDPGDLTATGVVTKVIIDDAGSGYSEAPGVAIHNGTLADPINFPSTGAEATLNSTLQLSGFTVDTTGTNYRTAPVVTITDPTGSGAGAAASATIDVGVVRAVNVLEAGDGYLSKGIKKFQDELPLTCDPGTNGTGCPTVQMTAEPATGAANKFIPLAVPEVKDYTNPDTGLTEKADEYVIGLVQYRTKFSSDLPATLVRGYVQISTPAVQGQAVPLYNELLDGTRQQIAGYTGVTSPQWMGPLIAATKDRPVRIVFRNLLPTGVDGDLFLPVDSSGMGAGMGPMDMATPPDESSVLDGIRNPSCTVSNPKGRMCFKDNRATLHLHGGITPWISDGTPHQWITPAGEDTAWPQGVSTQNVPDMVDATGAEICAAADDGCSTFYYTNQQSARLMFYHDHSWGITRLNVYAGEAAGYTITDKTEKRLVNDNTIPGAADTIPMIVQDRTFTPDQAQLKAQDPTWDTDKWGTKGSFWYHHVYMPAQNPGDPSGMSAYGRWMYGPWFWPPAKDAKYGPIANPYYDPACNLDDPSTWTYQTDPFCEPEQIPGTPNISMGMEQFNDTPIVNGVAYPKITLQPKTYRMRFLNAANDRFFNFQWYTADPTQGDGTTEVALKPGELAAAQTDPVVSPTPVGSNDDSYGPDWIQIANEGGFLPAPAVIDGQQPTTYITDATRFDVGNVDLHSLAVAPAERADVLVDFSKFAGKTLILYNDAPAAYPARVPQYDYYTGAPDLSPAGAPTPLAGYGPNTRTVMQVKIAGTPAPAFDLGKLRNAFKHHANGSGVFESGQNPVIVGQAGYNSAYGQSFASGSNCNAPNSTRTTCDGLVRVNDTTEFGFNTLRRPNEKMSIPLQPKAIHDEMNATTFDEFGRMTANLGIEAQPPTPGLQNVTLFPYVNPSTELIDATNLPTYDPDVSVKPIASADDGTQIWRFTHNGVDTHPMHFHLYDVQVLNRVTWDNIIIPPEDNELGWKDTVRMSPLEDTIVALRPIMPKVPFEVPNSVRTLNPMMPDGDTSMFNNVDVNGNPTANIVNHLVNFGWEYVIHCHILSHEEMDMMRPVSVVTPPRAPSGLTFTKVTKGAQRNRRVTVHWGDNSITETAFELQRKNSAGNWITVATDPSPLGQDNVHGARAIVDPSSSVTSAYTYRVVAVNTVGYGGEFPSMSARSLSAELSVPASTGGGNQNPFAAVIATSGQTLAVNIAGLTSPAVQWQVAGAPAGRVAAAAGRSGAGVSMRAEVGYTDIPGATSPTLPITEALRGRWVRAVVAYTDEEGARQAAMSDPMLVPVDRAGAVRIRKAASGERGGRSTAMVTWVPTTTGGAPILGYTVVAMRVDDGKLKRRHGVRVGSGVHTVTMHLRPGRYRFLVRAVTDVGAGLSALTKVVRAR